MAFERAPFSVSRQDWSFHHRGARDEARHNEKVKDAIKGNLQEIISDGSIITADPTGKKIVKVPMRSLEIPRIRYTDGKEGVGSGDGEVGDLIGSRPKKGAGKGKDAGTDAGVEYYEAELDLEEIQAMVFQDLGLPNLRPKARQEIESERVVFDDVRRKKTPNNIDVMRTLEANMMRNAQDHGIARIQDISPEDFRVRSWRNEIKEEESAAVIAMADISGSMGQFEQYIVRAISWWTVSFLRHKYPKVEIAFISHDTEAYEVTEDQFFKRGAGGGTKCSSANKMALDIMQSRYSPQNYNVYPLHFSDGGNIMDDNDKCIKLVRQMLDMDVSQYAYIQITGGGYDGNLMGAYNKDIQDPRFNALYIKEKGDVLPTLRKMFPPENQEE